MKRCARDGLLARLREAWGACPVQHRGNHWVRIVAGGTHNEHSSEVRCEHCGQTMRLPHGPLNRAAVEAGWVRTKL